VCSVVWIREPRATAEMSRAWEYGGIVRALRDGRFSRFGACAWGG
jgi:hypothetical protein